MIEWIFFAFFFLGLYPAWHQGRITSGWIDIRSISYYDLLHTQEVPEGGEQRDDTQPRRDGEVSYKQRDISMAISLHTVCHTEVFTFTYSATCFLEMDKTAYTYSIQYTL